MLPANPRAVRLAALLAALRAASLEPDGWRTRLFDRVSMHWCAAHHLPDGSRCYGPDPLRACSPAGVLYVQPSGRWYSFVLDPADL